jgi:RHS repeat-associated protein
VTWSSYQLPRLISGAGNNSAEFFYTPDRARWKQIASYGGTPVQTTYISGLIEKVTLGTATSWRHYVFGGSGPVAIYDRQSTGTNQLHYLSLDHLGSIDAVTDASGTVPPELRASFGAAGQRRNPTSWSGDPTGSESAQFTAITRRGFTFHEMLDNVNLTHMNGRVYDQTTGTFLSPDPFVPDAGSTQSYNRYAYTFGNPFKYTDPSGFVPSPDDAPGVPGCIGVCISFGNEGFSATLNFGFGVPRTYTSQYLTGVRLRGLTNTPLRGGATTVPVNGVECDMVACGSTRSAVDVIKKVGANISTALYGSPGGFMSAVKCIVDCGLPGDGSLSAILAPLPVGRIVGGSSRVSQAGFVAAEELVGARQALIAVLLSLS